MNADEKWNAVITNDRCYDGKFFYGVRSTGIFCRPSCASKQPKAENVVFFDSKEEAEAVGFRPCKRCRPELAFFDPVMELANMTKSVIDHNIAEQSQLQAKLNSLGVTRRHLAELFEKRYDLTLEQYITQVRLHRAKELLGEGCKITDVAFAIGMEGLSSFSTFFKKHEGISPSDYAAQKVQERPYCFCDTPLGLVHIMENQQGIISLKFADSRTSSVPFEQKSLYLADTQKQLLEYFAGKRKVFDMPLSVSGSAFQKKVWNALRNIPYGETRSYQQIAQMIGDGKAARAGGMANNRNPVLILIPCHRVVGKNGTLVGYAGGIERKQYLLELEASQ